MCPCGLAGLGLSKMPTFCTVSQCLIPLRGSGGNTRRDRQGCPPLASFTRAKSGGFSDMPTFDDDELTVGGKSRPKDIPFEASCLDFPLQPPCLGMIPHQPGIPGGWVEETEPSSPLPWLVPDRTCLALVGLQTCSRPVSVVSISAALEGTLLSYFCWLCVTWSGLGSCTQTSSLNFGSYSVTSLNKKGISYSPL